MSKVYLQAGVYSHHVGQTGHTHVRADDNLDAEQPMVIDCDACEPFLLREGGVHDLALVPLTDRQEREQKRIEREGSFMMQQASQAMATAAASVVSGGHAGHPARRVRRRGPRA